MKRCYIQIVQQDIGRHKTTVVNDTFLLSVLVTLVMLQLEKQWIFRVF